MLEFFHVVFYQPILNLLVFLYSTISFQDIGVAIILLTIVIKLLLLPLSKKSIKIQKAMQDIQPDIEELKKKYKDNKEEQGRALMALYKEKKVNPFSSCLPLLIQLPFLWAVFRVFRDDPSKHLDQVYPFLSNIQPESINMIAFGFLNLGTPNIVIAVMAGLAQFWQTKMIMNKKRKKNEDDNKEGENKKADEGMAAIMSKQMLYFMPIITIVIGSQLPGGLALYWLVVTILTGLQQLYVYKQVEKKSEPISTNSV
jgi:YidC/Oxa1 family membrane protein insertase